MTGGHGAHAPNLCAHVSLYFALTECLFVKVYIQEPSVKNLHCSAVNTCFHPPHGHGTSALRLHNIISISSQRPPVMPRRPAHAMQILKNPIVRPLHFVIFKDTKRTNGNDIGALVLGERSKCGVAFLDRGWGGLNVLFHCLGDGGLGMGLWLLLSVLIVAQSSSCLPRCKRSTNEQAGEQRADLHSLDVGLSVLRFPSTVGRWVVFCVGLFHSDVEFVFALPFLLLKACNASTTRVSHAWLEQ